ncbi:3-oxoacyl-ACP synthase III family protein [Nocardia pseudobrasiliensis]|uniref:3-oxoacyl-[acyl-carrier-protein] synthase III n=1 Tax=Nocardia pseudobrasiliensis TaxID=45979 RepID=A0A370HLA7_9NOCA|nr:ketoacyl-ACP synthase III [Nocardia pseudobrasiliensis]RDI58945.1 3-oxoacyl-[acyl-carrier-protein] synthase III [Nocardia pseudobrasiliensis]
MYHNISGDCLCGCRIADHSAAVCRAEDDDVDASISTAVLGTGSAVPEWVVTNHEIGVTVGVDDDWIRRKTGIRTRRWIRPGQATSDLAVDAARNALAAAAIPASDVSTLIVATSTPDHPLPPTACFVQQRLPGCRAAAFDLNAVCTGFLFALAIGRALHQYREGYVLVIGADTYSTILNPADRASYPLFGDGAGAVVLGPPRPGAPTLRQVSLFTDGAHADLIQVPAGGSRHPCTADDNHDSHYFTMRGRRVREFVAEQLPPRVTRFLSDIRTPADSITHVIAHQANKAMLDDLFPHLGLRYATLHDTVTTHGNTAAASIPLTLDHAVRAGKIAIGDTVLLVGFGAGMSIGLGLAQW